LLKALGWNFSASPAPLFSSADEPIGASMVPEPASLSIVLMGIAGAAVARRRRV
jgi:hypothetical protein